MVGKTLTVYSTKNGITAEAAYSIADSLKTTFNMDVTVLDLKNGLPDIISFQNIIVGGGIKNTNIYDEAVDFLENNFEDRNVALYFACEDEEIPTTQSTKEYIKKALAKNQLLKLVDVAAFGCFMLPKGSAVMDALNMKKAREWAIKVGKKFNIRAQKDLISTVPLENVFQFFTELDRNTGITANSTVDFAEKLQTIPIESVIFHFQRQDFQRWFKNTVGDEELAKRIDHINIWVHDENLKEVVSQMVQNRITELTKTSPARTTVHNAR